MKLGSDDYLILFALAATIALIAQTTWAIVDEGQDDHEAELSRTKLALVVRVRLFNLRFRNSAIDKLVSRS